MTQTSLSQGRLLTLLDQAYALHEAIGDAMAAIQNNDGPQQPAQWNELGIAAGAMSIAAEQLHQMVKRQAAAPAACDCADPDRPVPYTLAPDIEITVSRYGPCDCGGVHTLPEAIYLTLADGQ